VSGPINPPGPLDPSWQSLIPRAFSASQPVVRIPERGGVYASAGADVFPVAADVALDGAQLQEDLVRALGRDVSISVSYTAPAEDGSGVLAITDPKTGLPLEVGAALVDQVLAENSPPESPQARFLREYDAAETLEAKLDTFRDFIARQVDEEDRVQFLRRRTEGRTVDARTAMPMGAPARPPVPPRVTSRNPWTQRIQRGEA